MERNGTSPTKATAKELLVALKEGDLSYDYIDATVAKPFIEEKVTIPMPLLQPYFPVTWTAEQIKEAVVKACGMCAPKIVAEHDERERNKQ